MKKIKRIYRRLRDWKKLRFIGSEAFHSDISDNYEDTNLIDHLAKINFDQQKLIYQNQQTILNDVINIANFNKFNVVDYGGGLAKGFYQVDPQYINKCASWKVVETKPIVDIASRFSMDKKVTFTTNFDGIVNNKSDPTLIYSNSGIQYSGNMLELLRSMLEAKPELIVLERIPLIGDNGQNIVYAIQRSSQSGNYNSGFAKFFSKQIFYKLEIATSSLITDIVRRSGYNITLTETAEDIFSNTQYKIGLFNIICVKTEIGGTA